MELKRIGGTWQLVWKLLPHSAHCSEAPAETHTAQSSTSACREHSELQDSEGEAADGGTVILRHLWINYKNNMISYIFTKTLFGKYVVGGRTSSVKNESQTNWSCSNYIATWNVILKEGKMCESYTKIYLYNHTAECRAYLVVSNLLQ